MEYNYSKEKVEFGTKVYPLFHQTCDNCRTNIEKGWNDIFKKTFKNSKHLSVGIDYLAEINFTIDGEDDNVEIYCPVCEKKIFSLGEINFEWKHKGGYGIALLDYYGYDNDTHILKCYNCDFKFHITFGSYGG